MSGLRQLLGALWAAVWLRGRLVGLRLRRVFGGRVVDDGPDFHRAGVDAPVEGVGFGGVELPPELIARLEATRTNLLDHARSASAAKPRRRLRRRRTTSLAVASLLIFVIVGAGASALVTGTTGVPSVDRLLGIYEGISKSTGVDGAPELQRPAKAGTSVEAPLGEAGQQVVNAAYVGKDGDLCLALTGRDQDSGKSPRSLKCVDPGWLGGRLAEVGGQWSVTAYEAVVLAGVVKGDVIDLSAYGPDGPLRTYLGESWDPGLSGIGPVRLFLAIDNYAEPEDVDDLLDIDRYVVRGRLEDGSPVAIRP